MPTDLKSGIRLKGIELLNSAINLPPVAEVAFTDFSYTINVESKADGANQLIFVVITVEVRSDEYSFVLGVLSISCIYTHVHFEKIVKSTSGRKVDIPQALKDILNEMSLSTMRGVMFATFKGTFLHNAFLPMIDPELLHGKL
ncbi:MAG TPA: hypothetical protein VKQ52_14220 [Puia sp.]|nr:hypothetical protein [Puia sp.]